MAPEPGGKRLDKATANPLLVGLFFTIRCLVPLIVMLGISYLLKKLGLIQPLTEPPPGWNNGQNNSEKPNPTNSGNQGHDEA